MTDALSKFPVLQLLLLFLPMYFWSIMGVAYSVNRRGILLMLPTSLEKANQKFRNSMPCKEIKGLITFSCFSSLYLPLVLQAWSCEFRANRLGWGRLNTHRASQGTVQSSLFYEYLLRNRTSGFFTQFTTVFKALVRKSGTQCDW